jgi:phosphoenolpyruvate carboxylase
MRAAGISEDQVLRWLRKVEVTVVFTAHPTEVARRTVLSSGNALLRNSSNWIVCPFR